MYTLFEITEKHILEFDDESKSILKQDFVRTRHDFERLLDLMPVHFFRNLGRKSKSELKKYFKDTMDKIVSDSFYEEKFAERFENQRFATNSIEGYREYKVMDISPGQPKTFRLKKRNAQNLVNLRSKRGLIDGVGSVLKSLFGVTTENDMYLLRDELKTETGKIIYSHNIVESQVTYISSALQSTQEYLSQLFQKQAKRMESLNHLRIASHILDEWLEVKGALRYLLNIQKSTENRDMIMREGKAPPILNVSQLRKLIREAKRKFGHLEFPEVIEEFSKSSEMINSRQRNWIQVKPTSQPYKYIFVLPFIDSRYHGQLYSVLPFPFSLSNGTVLMPELDEQVVISNRTYSVLKDFKKCRKVNGNYLCEGPVAIHSFEDPNCSAGYVTQSNDIVNKFCHFVPVEWENNAYKVSYGNNWYVYFQNETSVRLTCSSKAEVTEKNHTGPLIVPAGCNLKTPHIQLTTIQLSHDGVTSHVLEMPMKTLNVPIFKPTYDHELLGKQIDDTINKRLESDVSDSIAESLPTPSVIQVSWAYPSIATIVLIIIIVVGVVCYCKGKL